LGLVARKVELLVYGGRFPSGYQLEACLFLLASDDNLGSFCVGWL